MEFQVYRTWEWENATKMKFDSLEELLEFTKQKQQEKKALKVLSFLGMKMKRFGKPRFMTVIVNDKQ